ncbi:hypothetical protein COT72_05350 [archaeon CG10_big_fil_rev_8_21_14_0_10_43_11]|nr:MAG: hypothetical protein COT72_05350 [archaeon CG10_big_fil_rev_8_21_14_0_10_43_11]
MQKDVAYKFFTEVSKHLKQGIDVNKSLAQTRESLQRAYPENKPVQAWIDFLVNYSQTKGKFFVRGFGTYPQKTILSFIDDTLLDEEHLASERRKALQSPLRQHKILVANYTRDRHVIAQLFSEGMKIDNVMGYTNYLVGKNKRVLIWNQKKIMGAEPIHLAELYNNTGVIVVVTDHEKDIVANIEKHLKNMHEVGSRAHMYLLQLAGNTAILYRIMLKNRKEPQIISLLTVERKNLSTIFEVLK